MTGLTFDDFLKGKKNKLNNNYEPKYNDWTDHLTTLFPQIRLKQYLEIRSMDACSWNEICAPAAFWTGILYDEISFEETYELIKEWSHEERLYFNKNVAIDALNTSYNDKNLLDISKKLLSFSHNGLERRNNLSTNKEYNETFYLKEIDENLKQGISPADNLLKKYNIDWNKSLDKIYEEFIF